MAFPRSRVSGAVVSPVLPAFVRGDGDLCAKESPADVARDGWCCLDSFAPAPTPLLFTCGAIVLRLLCCHGDGVSPTASVAGQGFPLSGWDSGRFEGGLELILVPKVDSPKWW